MRRLSCSDPDRRTAAVARFLDGAAENPRPPQHQKSNDLSRVFVIEGKPIDLPPRTQVDELFNAAGKPARESRLDQLVEESRTTPTFTSAGGFAHIRDGLEPPSPWGPDEDAPFACP